MWSELQRRAKDLPLIRLFFPWAAGRLTDDAGSIVRTSRPDAEGRPTDRWEGTLYIYGRLVVTKEAVAHGLAATTDEQHAHEALRALVQREADALVADMLRAMRCYTTAQQQGTVAKRDWTDQYTTDLLGRPIP